MTRRSILPLLLAASLYAQQPALQQRPQPRDVVSLSSPLTETVYLLGVQDRLAIVSDSSVFPEQAVADRKVGKIKVVSFGKPDLAQVEAAHPSLILTSTSFQRPIAEALRKKGFKVLHFEPESMEDIFRQTEQIGAALGQAAKAAEITAAQRSELADVARKSAGLPKIRVYMEINHNGPWTSGGKSVENEIIRLAGGENVFAEGPAGTFQTTNADVVKRNPDIILSPIWLDAHVGGMDGITTLVEISTRPGYADTTAVKNGRVLYYDSALLKQQGPREVLAIKKLAYLLHPDVFPNPTDTIPWELGRVRQ
jgi:iron complex transport system substrate-binding protein